MDPRVNGQMQKGWGWTLAVYLFLGGVGSGAYTIAAINRLLGENQMLPTTVGLAIGFPALLIGTLFLLADLGSPSRAWLAAAKPGSSWISRGTLIICAFMAVSFLHLVLHQFTGANESAGGFVTVLSILGIILAVSTMAYTGLLLGASKGIPFWRTGAVPVVFVVSALVTGHFAIMFGMILFGDAAALAASLRAMAVEAVGLMVLEVLAIAFFLQAAYQQPDSRESAERIMRKRLFVVGYFLLGLAAPLALMLAVIRAAGPAASSIGAVAAVGAILGLTGGLILRQTVLICGALPTLNMGGFQFRRIARPREPKAGIGLMPPR